MWDTEKFIDQCSKLTFQQTFSSNDIQNRQKKELKSDHCNLME